MLNHTVAMGGHLAQRYVLHILKQSVYSLTVDNTERGECEMNKKLVKTRNVRMNTLEAMGCSCKCSCTSCSNCSGGGSFTVTEKSGRTYSNIHAPAIVRVHDGLQIN